MTYADERQEARELAWDAPKLEGITKMLDTLDGLLAVVTLHSQPATDAVNELRRLISDARDDSGIDAALEKVRTG